MSFYFQNVSDTIPESGTNATELVINDCVLLQ